MPIAEIKVLKFPGAVGRALDTIQRTLNQVIRSINQSNSRQRSWLGPWMMINIPASSSSGLNLDASSAVEDEWPANRAGYVTGFSIRLTANAAGSNLRVHVFKNGSALHSGSISVGARQYTAKDLKLQFLQGDLLQVYVQTDSSWSGTTLDVSAWIEIET